MRDQGGYLADTERGAGESPPGLSKENTLVHVRKVIIRVGGGACAWGGGGTLRPGHFPGRE